jgi:hypothetical protein
MLGELAILHWFRKKAQAGHAREDGLRLIFPVTMPARLFFGGGALLLITVQAIAIGFPDVPWWQKVVGIPVAILAITRWPRRIVLNSTGVFGPNSLGLRKTLRWDEVRALDLAARRHEASIGDSAGARIRFSAFHEDLPRFVKEVRRRSPHLEFTSDL